MGICRKGWRYAVLPLAVWLLCGSATIALAQQQGDASQTPNGAQPPDLRGTQDRAPARRGGGLGATTSNQTGQGTAAARKQTQQQSRSNYTGMLDVGGQQNDPRAPAWLFVPRLELDLIGADNVSPQSGSKKADLISRFSAGGLLSVDTPMLSSYTNVLASYSKYANVSAQDHFSAFLFNTSHATFVPDYVFMDLHANITEFARDQQPVINPALLSRQNDIQTYILTASPYTAFRLGNIGNAELRYAGSWVWFNRQTLTPPVGAPPGLTGPISDSSQHQVHAEVVFPGTLVDRLFSDISAGAQMSDTKTIGVFRRNMAQWINEYQLTRSISVIGSGGYEQSFDKTFSTYRIDEPIWSAGARYRPTAESSIVLTYGRYDGATDFAGEAMVRLTPFTVVYAAYTDSITTSQQSLISNNSNAILPGQDGSSLLAQPSGVVGVTSEQNPTIATVDKIMNQILNSNDPTGIEAAQALDISSGLPLQTANSFYTVQNNIFRAKSLRGVIYRDILGNTLSVEGYRVAQTSLLTLGQTELVSYGAIAGYSMPLSDYLIGKVSAGYRKSDVTNSDAYTGEVMMTYLLGRNLLARARYNFLRNEANLASRSYTQNAITLTVQMSF